MNNVSTQITDAIIKLGKDIRSARRRRHMSLDTLAAYAGISRTTLHKIERGDSAVSIGNYGSVISFLGKTTLKRLADVTDPIHDPWQDLDEEHLPKRIRLRRPSQSKRAGNLAGSIY